MRRWLFAALLGALWSSCGSPPCKDCPPVAGTYRMTIAPTSPHDSSCTIYYFTGGTADLAIQQANSTLTISGLAPATTIKGTLHENLYVQFSSFEGTAQDGTTTTNYISGRFSQADGVWQFKGTWDAEIDQKITHGCGASTSIEGPRVE